MALFTTFVSSRFQIAIGAVAGDATQFTVTGPGGLVQTYFGSGFTYSDGVVTGGLIDSTSLSIDGVTQYSIDGVTVPAHWLGDALSGEDAEAIRQVLMNADDAVDGAAGDDFLSGYDGSDTISGGDGHDVIDGGAGADTMAGGIGDDVFIIAAASDHALLELIEGGDGLDAIFFTSTAPGEVFFPNAGWFPGTGMTGVELIVIGDALGDTSGTSAVHVNARFVLEAGLAIVGNDGTNFIGGTIHADALLGNGGDDTLSGGSGDDTLDGGAGIDTVINLGAPGPVTVDLGQGFALDGDGGTDTLTDIENAEGSDFGDTLIGDGAANRLSGFLGDDTLDGGAGNDTMVGGDGDDQYVVDAAGDSVMEGDAPGGFDTVRSSVSFSLAAHADIENLTLTGSSLIDATGNDLANTLVGNDSNNRLDGGAGADTLAGGLGDDVYVVDDTSDQAIEDAGAGLDTVSASVTWILAANVENLVLAGDAAIDGTGNGLANVITGNAAANVLDGAGGADTLQGGAGSDVYIVGDESVVAVDVEDGGDDVVRSSVSYVLEFHIERLELQGSGDLDGTGNDLDNLITGTAGSNHLDGNAGNDTLIGAGGDDLYTVGGGDLVVELEGDGSDAVRAFFSGDLFTYVLPDHIERLQLFSSFGTGIGNALDNVIEGMAMGAYVIDGGAGADTMAGGAGSNVYFVDNALDVVLEDAVPTQVDVVRAVADYALPDNVEDLVLEGVAVNGTGNDLANRITGNSLANLLQGGAGADTLNGGGGADTMAGGTGDDVYLVQGPGESYVELAGEGIDTIRTPIDVTLADGIDNAVLLGVASTSAVGNVLANLLLGNRGDNAIDGGAGADTMRGGPGDDTYAADDAGDVVSESMPFSLQRASSTLISSPGNFGSSFAALSFDGRFVAFQSHATNFDAGDPSVDDDIYLKDMETGALQAVSTTPDGAHVYSDSGRAVLSDDARYVAFEAPGGLLPEDNNVRFDVLLKDLQTGALAIVSTSSTGEIGNELSGHASMTSSGQLIAFQSVATNLVASDVNGASDVFLKHLSTGETLRVSLDPVGGEANGQSFAPSLAADGSRVAFTSWATNLVSGDDNGVADVYVKTLAGGAVVRASTSSTGVQANGDSGNASVSGDGRWVAFESNASNLVAGDGNGASDVFAKDLSTGEIKRVSPGNGQSWAPAISADGRFIAFLSAASDLVEGDTNGIVDVFVADQFTGAVARVSIGHDGSQAAFPGQTPAISGDGRFVAFHCGNLPVANGPAAGGFQVYVAANPLADEGGADAIDASVDYTLPEFVENLNLVGAGSISGFGNALANLLTGNGGANVLSGGAGADTMAGGAGSDTYVVDNAGDVVTEGSGLANGTADEVQSSIAYALGLNVERLTLTGNAALDGTGNGLANVITGNGAANRLIGGNGNDTLFGDGGNDTLTGSLGADAMAGGAGNDIYNVDHAGDGATEFSGEGNADQVNSSVDFVLGAHVERLILTGSADLQGTGNDLGNRMMGNSGANTLDGAGGADTLIGGLGSDTYIQDHAGDVTTEALNAGTDTVHSSVTAALRNNVENLTLTGTAAIGVGNALDNVLTGNDVANALRGSGGDDMLIGGVGNDSLRGGTGNDTLEGGAGVDRFFFEDAAGAANADMVIDFVSGQDRLHLNDSAFTQIGSLGLFVLDDARFAAGASLTSGTDAEDRIVYDTTTGNLYYDADGLGGSASQIFATLQGAPALAAMDIVVL